MINIKINETFQSLQGEGAYTGYPVLFIRTSGCTRTKENGKQCLFCDSKYSENGQYISNHDLVGIIRKSPANIVVWTGGEPALQIDDILNIIKLTKTKKHHLETNGDINLAQKYYQFDYVCFSPKDETAIKNLPNRFVKYKHDVKVVYDGEQLNFALLPYATLIMPLTTYTEKDMLIKQKVWDFCVQNNKRFCLRSHVEVWSNKRAV